jgi:hypothetical protein
MSASNEMYLGRVVEEVGGDVGELNNNNNNNNM